MSLEAPNLRLDLPGNAEAGDLPDAGAGTPAGRAAHKVPAPAPGAADADGNDQDKAPAPGAAGGDGGGQTTASAIPFQAASLDIWESKYCLKTKRGEALDKSMDDTFKRVAAALAEVEAPEVRERWQGDFLWALRQGAIPAGRIVSNAGASEHKPATSTINCTVSATIHDSMEDILQKNMEAGLTLKAGCGIGYEFSTLRPKGAYVSGAGAYTSGPLSFMDIYDKTCFTVSSAGGRRGAQMATFDVSHPDVTEFIRVKREDARLRQFNLSLLITTEFMEAVKAGADWPLSFPLTPAEQETEQLDLADPKQVVWRDFPSKARYITNGAGQVACRIRKTIKARRLWDLIMASTYDFAEPGFILIDKVNEMNNNWFCEKIRATNPCGEQPLPPYGSCLLGSINLCSFVAAPFSQEAAFDWQRFAKVVAIFTRMLDNVVEVNGLPLPQQQEEITRKRRHGMGYLGLGSAIAMLGMRYGDAESVAFTEEVTKQLALVGWQTGLELAREKGPAPIMEEDFTLTAEHLHQRPELAEAGHKAGDTVKGRTLLARHSRYMQRLAQEAPELVRQIAEEGCRFTHHSSIAPTGTISLSLANNASNGIEPSFAHHYARNVIREGKKSKEKVDVFSYELLAYRALVDAQASPESGRLPECFVVTDDVTPIQHVDIQAAAQKWIDSSISKTANVPTDYPFEDFKDIYLYAYEQGLKGCTTFRFNPEVHQGVLVKEEDLAGTTYQFQLESGEVIEARGNEEIEYDGETHSAANLFDAMKEGYYGKF